MTKIESFFVGLCVILWTSTTCDSTTPQETYKQWLSIKTTLELTAPNFEGQRCNATPEQTLSWVYLRNLFDEKKGYGIMRFAWPRLSFYTKELALLTESPLDPNLIVCTYTPDRDDHFFCFENQCKNCHHVYDQDVFDPGDILWSVCEKEYADPEKEKEDEERKKELKTLWKPPVASPGPLDLNEVNSWIQVKVKEKKNLAEKEGDECDAPQEFSMSLSYLQRLSEKPDVAKELEDFPKFYEKKLRWLKEADKSIVSCRGNLVCGWDGLCVHCQGNYFENELAETCMPESRMTYKNPREPYKIWAQDFLDITQRSVDSKKDDKTCDANEWKSESWFYLMQLFQLHQKGGVMKWAWPRISFYEKNLKVVDGSTHNTFCEWDVNKMDDIFLCDYNKCKECSELDLTGKYNKDDSFYKKLCEGAHEKSEAAEVNEELKNEWKDPIVPVEEPKGVLTLEDALSWNGSLGSTATAEKWGDCDTHPKLTLSQKYLLIRLMKLKEEGAKEAWRWRTEEEVKEAMSANKTTYDEKLRWLKGAEKSREFYGDDLVCSPDGVCVPCGAATDKVEELKEACTLEIEVVKASGAAGSAERKLRALMTFAAILGLLQL